MANITGWGRGTWGEGAWNAPLAVEVTGVSGTTSVGSETVVPQAVVSVTNPSRLLSSFNLEHGLTLDGLVNDGQTIGNGSDIEDITNDERAQDIVLAAEMDLPSSFSKASCIWECGGTGRGAWFGISEQSGAYFLRFRAGDGTSGHNTANSNLAIAQVAISSLSGFFDGNTHTLVWAVDISAGKVEIYIDGTLVADGTTSDGSSLNSFAGGADGAFGVASGTPAGSESDDGSTQFQSSDAFTGTIRSDLRMYKNEFLITQASSTVTGGATVVETGVVGTTAVGNEVSFTNVVVIETGLQGTTGLGIVVSDGAAVGTTSGVVGTSALGNTTETGTGVFSVTGVVGTSAVGTENAAGQTIVSPTGLGGTSSLGNTVETGTASFSVTGVVGTSAVGNEGITTGSLVIETGLSATGAIGTVTVVPSIEVVPTGASSTGGIGDVLAAGGAKVTETALTGTVNIGDEAVSGDANLSVTGVSATTKIDKDDVTTVYTVTVVGGNPSNHPYYNQGSTNKYAIDGSTATADVVLTLTEGQTYRFDQSDSSNSGHPIAIYEDADKTTQYTTGVTTNGTAGSAGAYTEITVPIGAPTLFYQCTNHALMGAQLNTVSATTLIVTGGAAFAVTGLAGTSAIGTATGVPGIQVTVTTVVGTMSLGNVTSSGTFNFPVTGVEATAALGTLNLYGVIANEVSVSYTEVVPSQNANYKAA